MKTIATPEKTLALLKKHQFRFTKSLGQNFLVDNNILKKIVDASSMANEDKVIEVGPGIGTLTLALAQMAKSIVTLEIDKTLIPILTEVLKNLENVSVVQTNALKLNSDELRMVGQSSKFVSNLPYNIATPLLIQYLLTLPQIKKYTFMVQKEVADRIVARPGSKKYGVSSVKIQYFCQAKILFPVSRNVFIPKPKVDSAVVGL